MAAHGVNTLIYSSTCATYGEPDKMPITEETPQVTLADAVESSYTCFFFFFLLLLTLVKNDKKKFYQFPINPYGKAKKMAEDIILDFSKTNDMAIMILRFVNVSNKLY